MPVDVAMEDPGTRVVSRETEDHTAIVDTDNLDVKGVSNIIHYIYMRSTHITTRRVHVVWRGLSRALDDVEIVLQIVI